MDDLFDRRLIIQSGKGGTGKTTISAALAVLAARRGKRTLLIELDTNDRFAPLFGRKAPIEYEPVEVRPNLFARNLDPGLVIVDFFQTHVRWKSIYKQILDSKIFQRFYEAAPGVREIICMGKVWRILGERAFFSGRNDWDCVILDAPATGHGISLLNIANAAYETLFGPMKKHAEKIRDMLRDPATTALNIIAIPEDMPVNEAADLARIARDELKIPLGKAFMNAAVAPLFDAEEAAVFARESAPGGRMERLFGGGRAREAALACVEAREQRARMSERLIQRMRETVPLPLVTVPRVYEVDREERTLAAVVASLEASLAPGAASKLAGGA